MPIEKIACPRLNGESLHNSGTTKEVFVYFEGIEPRRIMCDEYNLEKWIDLSGKECIQYICSLAKVPSSPCIYEEWKPLIG